MSTVLLTSSLLRRSGRFFLGDGCNLRHTQSALIHVGWVGLDGLVKYSIKTP